MIRKIENIREFGVFKNFEWNGIADLKNFNQKNIFYGWNYSGKTTLSRIFKCLKDKAMHPGFPNGSFKVLMDDGSYDSVNVSNFPHQVEVFNAEYIAENLRWEFDDNINAITFEVGENAKIKEKIADNITAINAINGTETIKGKRETHQKQIDKYSEFENGYTNEARRIKNDVFLSLIEFNKGHLKKVKDAVIADLSKYIIEDEDVVATLYNIIKVEAPKDKLNRTTFNSAFEEIMYEANQCLNSEPSKTEIIEILENNPVVYNWAKEGLNIHRDNTICSFCNNTIDEERIKTLTLFFNNEASRLREKVLAIEQLIVKENNELESIDMPASSNDLNEGFQQEYIKHKKEFDLSKKKYVAVLQKIKVTLTEKLNKDIYNAINITIDASAFANLMTAIEKINMVIDSNNNFVDNFQTIIEIERTKCKQHLVANYLKSINYIAVKKKAESAEESLSELDDEVFKLENENLELYGQISNIAAGCEQLNLFIKDFLGRDDILITVNESGEKFNLKRGEDLAKNLSEGEKSAIAFAYFLVYLASLKERLANCIIFIDDPISSLDSNHIFQINSILKDAFCHKVPNPQNNGQLMWSVKCKQLFISTHNFEFFNLLKELPPKTKAGESKYFVLRKHLTSTIEPLPQMFDDYSSEYHYLFSEIVSFTNDENKQASHRLMLMPNIFRRFVELYTLTKYPSNEEVDIRADKVFGEKSSKRILKLLHFFSHLNNLDRIAKQSDLISDIDVATTELIDHIKTNDLMHYEALVQSTK